MVAKGPVSVNWQSLFIIIPIVDLWAAYRIQKLRIFLLIFVVGFGAAFTLIEIGLAGGVDEFFRSDYLVSDFEMIGITIAMWTTQIITAIILIRFYSKKWNLKFQTVNS